VIRIATNNSELAGSIKRLTNKLGVRFDWIRLPSKKSSEKLERRVYAALPNVIKAPIYLLYYIIDRWELKRIGVDRWGNSTATITFISYFFNLDVESAEKGIYNDGYWTKLPNLLGENRVESNWLHLYVKSDFLSTTVLAKELIEKFNKKNSRQNHFFLDSFLSFRIVSNVVICWIKLLFKYGKIKSGIKQQTRYLWPLIKTDLKVSLVGVSAIQNILYYNLFRDAMQLLPEQQKGLYLQENQGWEFGLVSAWREFGHGQIIGVPHSTVRYWDLRYFFNSRLYKQKNYLKYPFPDKVAINGKVAKKRYLDGGYPLGGLIEVEALRYLYLNKEVMNKEINLKKNSILVLGDSEKNNTLYLMSLLEQFNEKIRDDMDYVVKPHPLCPIRSKDYPSLRMTVSNRPILELINECFMSLTANVTSAAVDVYCAGKKVITVLDEKSLNLSPLKGCNDVSFVSSADELANIINGIAQVEVNPDQGKGYFYLDMDLPRWRELLLDEGMVNKKMIWKCQNSDYI